MAEKQRVEKAYAKTLHLGTIAMPKIIAGQVSVTGSGTITVPVSASPGDTGINTITAVQATLAAAAASGEAFVTATFSGPTVTLSVYTAAYAASSTATVVNYTIFGY